MRTLIATALAAALALSPATALAQDNNVVNTTDTANTVAPPPADANLSTTLPPTDNMTATTEVPPVADPAMTAETAAPAEDDDGARFPWGLLGLLGLVGLLGRNRSTRT